MQPQRGALPDGAAFFERDAPHDVRAESAGTDPARRIWPEVVQVMAEVGIDLSAGKPRKLLREMQLTCQAPSEPSTFVTSRGGES